jgi:hypothetical protein
MAVGRTESGHGSTAEGEARAREGVYGRIAPPPDGAIYIRDPAAARAEAIREQYALYQVNGLDVPAHLQALYDELATPATDLDVDLVDAVTGTVLAEVELVSVDAPVAKFIAVDPQAPPEVVEVALSGEGGAGVEVAQPEPELEPEPEPEPEPAAEPVTRTARKTIRR